MFIGVKKNVSNESWRQKWNARCMFCKRFSGSLICLMIKQQKVNDPELSYDMRTFSNLMKATLHISHVYFCSRLLSSDTYGVSAQAETLETFICPFTNSLHATHPTTAVCGPHHWRHRTSRATSWWKSARDAERAVVLANIQQRKWLQCCNGVTGFRSLYFLM